MAHSEALWCGVLASGLFSVVAAQHKTAYPLFSISNKPDNWTDADVNLLVNSFTLSDGLPSSDDLLNRTRKANPSFRSVRYCNPRGIALKGPTISPVIMALDEFETHHRLESMFYTAGFLGAELSASSTRLSLAHPLAVENRSLHHCALRNWTIIPSDPRSGKTSQLIAKDDVAYVTYLRIDDEIVKIVAASGLEPRSPQQPPFDRNPPQPAVLNVIRGFGGTQPASHAKGARVLSPASLDSGVSSNNVDLQWAVGMSSPLAPQLLINYTLADVKAGYSGAWYDNFGASLFNGKTTTGCALRTHEYFDPVESVHWDKPSFLAAQQRRFSVARNVVQKALGRTSPVPAVGNGYGILFPNGTCEVDGPCASLQDIRSAFEKGFVDGWILEGFYGNEVFESRQSCGTGGEIAVHPPDIWKQNEIAIAWAAQNNVPAFPIIFQAGCKSSTLEVQNDTYRSFLEEGAYASFLLGVEKAQGDTESSLTFGINSIWRDMVSQERYVRLHPQYFYPIGNPTVSHTPDKFDDYQIMGASGVYGRTFSNGLVLYNVLDTGTDSFILPDGPWMDPVTNKSATKATLPARAGKIFIKHW